MEDPTTIELLKENNRKIEIEVKKPKDMNNVLERMKGIDVGCIEFYDTTDETAEKLVFLT